MEDRWAKLEEIVRRVVREEVASLKKKPKIELLNGKYIGISADQMEAWRAAYAAVDLESEIRRAAAWCISNPAQAPKDHARFLNAWMSREQNRAAIRSIPLDRPTEVKKKLCAYCDAVAQGQVGGIWACDGHWQKAMDRDPVPHMRGVVAKPVAGA
jgi:hypothetical protein